ncbi:MAG: hypothetical protein QM808_05720 [Steroidobacteraceae bacterium]
MSSGSSPVLTLELRHHWLRLLPAGVLLSFSLTLPWLADLASRWQGALSAVGVCLALFAVRQAGYGPKAVRLVGVVWQQNQTWQLRFADGANIPATLLGHSWQSSWLLCLSFTDMVGQRRQAMFWRPEVNDSLWQQWRLRLRLEATRASAVRELTH